MVSIFTILKVLSYPEDICILREDKLLELCKERTSGIRMAQDSGENWAPFLTFGASPPGPFYAHYNPAAPVDPLQPSRTYRS